MQTIAVLQVTFQSHQKVDHSSYPFGTLAPFSKLPDNIFKFLNSTQSISANVVQALWCFFPVERDNTLKPCTALFHLNG